ncbi:lectin-like domain-containing protein [Frondihabitans sp. Leaf304]|uniref:lectin-like domain-containing protein n=1 Tax=Frondihabitans sp. Leaf304 TaxID=1736329 RepID=UPI000700B1AE|nr:DUF11 domain-containing protein [Frondihabitans sp. Leaf304]KQQ27581.1 hypothetical protein ASF54_01970 [Frondihabitans sp. Leaf304]
MHPTRPRRTVAAVAVAAVVTALALPAATAEASAAPRDFPLPFEQNFTAGAAGGTLLDDAAVDTGWLRLTTDTAHHKGSWITDEPFDTTLGLDITFDYGMYADALGGDGISFFLADGDAQPATGAHGAGLGYSCMSTTASVGDCTIPGVPGGYLGIGFDEFGNFSLPLNNSGPGRAPSSIAVRGSGDGLVGYPYQLGAPAPGGSLMTGDRAGARSARIRIQPAGKAVRFTVQTNRGGDTPLETVFDDVDVNTWSGQASLPPTLRLGFAASTGTAKNLHEIDNLRVTVPADLAISKTGPAEVVPGRAISWEVTATNPGENPVANALVRDSVPSSVSGVTWSCAASAGSACHEASGSGNTLATHTDLNPGGSATYRLTGTVDPAATGVLDNTATVEVPADRNDGDLSNNTATASTALTPQAEISTTKTYALLDQTDELVAPGEDFTYTITAQNAGPSSARAIGATDALPAGIHFVASDDGCTATGQNVTCSSTETLAVSGSKAFTFTARLDADYVGDGSDLANIGVATSPDDADGGTPSEPVTIPVTDPPKAELTTDKRAVLGGGKDTVAPGDSLDYVMTATNNGTAPATDVGMVDDLPRGLTFTAGDDCTATGQRVTCASDRTLRPGESTSFRITTTLDPAYAGDGADLGNIAIATSSSDADGADPSPRVFIPVAQGEEPSGPPSSPNPVAAAGSGSVSGPSTPLRLAFTGSQGIAGVVALALALGAAGVGLVGASRRRRRS